MKQVMKVALGALMLAGAAAAVVTPAEARISFGIGVGGPVYAGYYGPGYAGYNCDPYSRWYAPAYCGAGYYGYGPSVVIGGHFGGGGHGGGFHDGGFHGGGHWGHR